MMNTLPFGVRGLVLTAASVLSSVTAAAEKPGGDAGAFAAPVDLRATLIDPSNIVVQWKDRATAEGGYFVEYALPHDREFLILGAVPADATRFEHSDLASGTRFIYRVRPFFGPSSELIEITTGPAPPDAAAAGVDPEWDEPRIARAAPNEKRASIRTMRTAAAAGPADLRARLVTPTTVALTWADRASDEDGYLVEIRPADAASFRVCALLEPDTVGFGLAGLPPETKCTLRVRAFFYGAPSNQDEATTGGPPSVAPAN